MKFPVIFETSDTGYAAYVPDLPGCVAAGETLDETRSLLVGAIEMHVEAMRNDGETIPFPSMCEMLEVDVRAPA